MRTATGLTIIMVGRRVEVYTQQDLEKKEVKIIGSFYSTLFNHKVTKK